MNALRAAAQHPLAVLAGWTALVVLWQSLVVALALAAWRGLRGSASAEAQHRAALGALTLCVAGLVLVPGLLTWWPAWSIVAVPGRAQAVLPFASSALATGVVRSFQSAVPAHSGLALNATAGLVGVVWLAGSCLLLVRLAGGWWQVSRVRGRAVETDDRAALDTLARVTAQVCAGAPVALLVSRDVEAPVVIGARRPVLLLPDDLSAQLGDEALAPLIAHECAHVRRSDYLVNVAQSVVDALLFFSPAVRWISHIARETREYCCDDIALRWCDANRSAYVRALTTVASLGSRNRAQPVLGAAGPRLVTRVRRLLSEDTMPRPAVARSIGTFILTAFVAATGWPVLELSSASLASAAPAGAQTVAGAGLVPIAWVMRQPASSVIVGPIEGDGVYAAATATLKNVVDVAVTSVDVVAFVGGRPAAVPPQARGVKVDVLIEPGNSTTVALHLLDRPQLAEMRSAIGEPRQAFIGLTSVRFANGAQWTATPNAAGRTLEEIFGLPPAQVARQLVGVPSESNWLCYDQDRGEYSPGAVVPVRDEPGRYVECDKGLWRDYDLASTQEQRASESTNGFTVNLSGASLDEILNAVGSATGMTITRALGVPNTTGLNLRLQRARTEELLDVLRIALPPELECRWVDSRTIVVEPRDARPAEPPTQKDTEPPRALKQVRPEYPRALVAQAIEGNVLVTITVGADGKVKDAIVTKSLSRDLDAEALKAAKQWVFKPGTKDGVPVEVKTELEFTFEVR